MFLHVFCVYGVVDWQDQQHRHSCCRRVNTVVFGQPTLLRAHSSTPLVLHVCGPATAGLRAPTHDHLPPTVCHAVLAAWGRVQALCAVDDDYASSPCVFSLLCCGCAVDACWRAVVCCCHAHRCSPLLLPMGLWGRSPPAGHNCGVFCGTVQGWVSLWQAHTHSATINMCAWQP